jgi:hypothetical protein
LLAEHRVKIGQKNISAWWFILGAAIVAFLIYVSTMQVVINGLTDPYTTDVGEIQNALPRWGTLHFTGYPQYTFIGSIFVTILGWLGMAPAAAASLYSAVWGAISIALLVWLIIELDVPTHLAVIPALLFGLSGSMWMDASIAELHTMTMALTFGALLTAVRFGRDGKTSDLYWLAFLSGQGLAHQRAFAFMGLGLLILVIHQWRLLLDWKRLFIVIGLMLLGPLTYIYLPIRAWMGADWTFSSPGTWEGFKALILDTKADRIVSTPSSLAEMWERTREILRLLNDDWPWPVWIFGLLGLFLPGRSWRERWGLTFVWLPYFVLSLIIWEGRVSDALLAVKMPIIAMSAVGLAFWSQWVWQRSRVLGYAAMVMLLLFGGYLFVTQRQVVLAITRDESAYKLIELAAAIPPAEDSRPQTLMALWGDDFWPLAYAQTYEGYYPDLNVVHHDNDFAAIIRSGDHLLTLSRTFYQRPVEWWQGLLGPVYLTSVAPEIVEIQVEPRVTAVSPENTLLDLGNGIAIQNAELVWNDDDTLHLAVDWQALQDDLGNYSIAVHLVAQDPPTGPQDILTQADRNHPVAGWYPSSLWQAGEVVTDHFLLEVPEGSVPVAVRVGMYQALADGTFKNSEWLSLPVP